MNFKELKKKGETLAAQLGGFNVGGYPEVKEYLQRVESLVKDCDTSKMSVDAFLEAKLADDGQIILVFGFSPGFGVANITARHPLPDELEKITIMPPSPIEAED